ncbi:MAG: corrinoid protein [Clostridiales bacterium]|nr:corrinoid protein [Clostridiales bacterium]
MSKEKLFKEAFDAIVECEEEKALGVVKEALAEGVDLVELLTEGFGAGIKHIGDQFGCGEVFLPELIYASEVMKTVSTEIESNMEGGGAAPKGLMVIGTVAGDVHDIGKGIVASLVKSNGVDVFDLGREVPAEEFIKKAKELGADFIGSSALLTTTMTEQKKIEELIAKEGLKGKVKTLVGGAPVTKRWADRIGADYYCEDASEAVNVVLGNAQTK